MSESPMLQLRYIDKCTECRGLGWASPDLVCPVCHGKGWTPKAEYSAYLSAKRTGTIEHRLFIGAMVLIAGLLALSFVVQIIP